MRRLWRFRSVFAEDVWASLWLAELDGGADAWREVLRRLQEMKAAGTLAPVDEKFIDSARANAAVAERKASA